MHMNSRRPSRSVYQDPKVIFLHIPKTAGMTLKVQFEKNYQDRPIFNTQLGNIFTGQNWNQFQGLLQRKPFEERNRYGLYKGHMNFGLHKLLSGPVEYITFLRDPVQRVISHYRMLRRHEIIPPDQFLNPSRLSGSYWGHPDFYRSFDNAQTRALSGADPDLPLGCCTEEHLRQAEVNIESSFKLVGLTEQFDLSLLLLHHLCGWGIRFYVPRNVAPPSTGKISPRVLEAIREWNHLDYRLYRFAEERFQRQVERLGYGLKLEHALYRLGNRVHQRIHRLRHGIKRRLGVEPGAVS
jgi:hypothetical protein